jgi:hypothetical protein
MALVEDLGSVAPNSMAFLELEACFKALVEESCFKLKALALAPLSRFTISLRQ